MMGGAAASYQYEILGLTVLIGAIPRAFLAHRHDAFYYLSKTHSVPATCNCVGNRAAAIRR